MTTPILAGGQGRTPEDLRQSAAALTITLLLALAAVLACVICR